MERRMLSAVYWGKWLHLDTWRRGVLKWHKDDTPVLLTWQLPVVGHPQAGALCVCGLSLICTVSSDRPQRNDMSLHHRLDCCFM